MRCDVCFRPECDCLCEQEPYRFAGYHCLLKRHHGGPHSDLVLMWDDEGDLVNADGSKV